MTNPFTVDRPALPPYNRVVSLASLPCRRGDRCGVAAKQPFVQQWLLNRSSLLSPRETKSGDPWKTTVVVVPTPLERNHFPTVLRAELSYDGPSHPTCPDMGAPTNNVVPSHNNA